MGPGIVARLSSRSDVELASLVRDGLPARGMPALALAGPELRQLLAFLRTLRAPDAEALPRAPGRDGRWRHARRRRPESVAGRPAVAHRRRPPPPVAAGRARRYRRVTSDVDWPGYHGAPTGNRFSRLDRINRGNVARLAPAWMFALSGAERLQVTPVVVERRDVCHQRQRVLRARRRIGPPHLALPAAAHEGIGRRRRGRDQPRRGCRRRPRLHRHRRRAAAGAEPVHRRARCGTPRWPTGGRTTARRRRRWSSAAWSFPASPAATRACAGFWPRSIRPRVRKSGVSGPCHGRVNRVRRRGAAGTSSTAARPRGSPAPTTPISTRCTGRPAIRVRTTTGASGWATTCTRIRFWRSIRRTAVSSGTFSTRRTTSGIGTRSSRRSWWTRRGVASRAACCCTRIATASSTSWIGPAARCCRRPPS